MPEFRLKTKTNQTETEAVPKPSLPKHEKDLTGKRRDWRVSDSEVSTSD